jgi:hypothetical protein
VMRERGHSAERCCYRERFSLDRDFNQEMTSSTPVVFGRTSAGARTRAATCSNAAFVVALPLPAYGQHASANPKPEILSARRFEFEVLHAVIALV